ncbi:MAG: hypothetical protein MR000_12695 [Cloacibacillus porcorum]|uniref:hypothetical protein n=1 Tax=Cloacibacillus porcorum TaxID=1197717 RepID=UPI002352042D|nr:hypothetical protein [Cloacibacillus porcorum]MCI5866075.1 hypothetical protein [Cloacibacillus porcorum]
MSKRFLENIGQEIAVGGHCDADSGFEDTGSGGAIKPVIAYFFMPDKSFLYDKAPRLGGACDLLSLIFYSSSGS